MALQFDQWLRAREMAQREHGEAYTACNECGAATLIGDGPVKCDACREKYNAYYREQYAKNREQRKAYARERYQQRRKPTMKEMRSQRELELNRNGQAYCPRCQSIKDMYDGFTLCEHCRKVARERMRAKRGRK